jgi:hypothetical protein
MKAERKRPTLASHARRPKTAGRIYRGRIYRRPKTWDVAGKIHGGKHQRRWDQRPLWDQWERIGGAGC